MPKSSLKVFSVKQFFNRLIAVTVTWKKPFSIILILLIGISIGGYVFRDVRSRPILEVRQCQQCWGPSELAGLLTSLAIHRVPGILPEVVVETDKSIAIKYPLVTSTRHYLVFPKKDIKDAGELSPADQASLVDIYAVLAQIIREQGLKDYRIVTNGEGLQDIRYLHFHLYEVK